jgi:hypothetical protein
MWSRLDDALIDHRKIFIAADALGDNGGVLALGMYAWGLMYTNKHLTDGFLPLVVVRRLPLASDPITLAQALTKARLWNSTKRDGVTGYAIHDFADWNTSSDTVKKRRQRDRLRKQRERDARDWRRHHGKGKRNGKG